MSSAPSPTDDNIDSIVLTRDTPADTEFYDLARDLSDGESLTIIVNDGEDAPYLLLSRIEPLAWHTQYRLHDTACVIADVEGGQYDTNSVAVFLRETFPDVFPADDDWSVSVTVEGDFDQYLQIEQAHPIPEQGYTYRQLADLAWDFAAMLRNVTDPGTFNCPYLIGSAARIMRDKNGYSSEACTREQATTAMRYLMESTGSVSVTDADVAAAVDAMTVPGDDGFVYPAQRDGIDELPQVITDALDQR